MTGGGVVPTVVGKVVGTVGGTVVADGCLVVTVARVVDAVGVADVVFADVDGAVTI